MPTTSFVEAANEFVEAANHSADAISDLARSMAEAYNRPQEYAPYIESARTAREFWRSYVRSWRAKKQRQRQQRGIGLYVTSRFRQTPRLTTS